MGILNFALPCFIFITSVRISYSAFDIIYPLFQTHPVPSHSISCLFLLPLLPLIPFLFLLLQTHQVQFVLSIYSSNGYPLKERSKQPGDILFREKPESPLSEAAHLPIAPQLKVRLYTYLLCSSGILSGLNFQRSYTCCHKHCEMPQSRACCELHIRENHLVFL